MSSNDSAVVVAVRVRPPSRRELSAGAKAVVAVDNNSLSVTDPTALMAMENLRGSSGKVGHADKEQIVLTRVAESWYGECAQAMPLLPHLPERCPDAIARGGDRHYR